MRASLNREDPDYIYWNNEEWEIVDIDEDKQLVCPRCARRRKQKLTKPRQWNTRGYIAHFSVHDGCLQLDWLDTTNRYPPKPDTPEVKRAYDLPIRIPYTGSILVCQNPTQNYSGNYDSIMFSAKAVELQFISGRLSGQLVLSKWQQHAELEFNATKARELVAKYRDEITESLQGHYGACPYRTRSRDLGQDCVLCSMMKGIGHSA